MAGPGAERYRRGDHALHRHDLRPGSPGAAGRRHGWMLVRERLRSEPGAARVSHPQDLTLRDQAGAIGSGALDASELLRATLERIEERNPPINAIVATFPEESE